MRSTPKTRRILELAALPEPDQQMLHKQGLPRAVLTELARTIKLTPDALLQTLGLDPATIDREVKDGGRLSSDTSERLLRCARLLLTAGDVFSDQAAIVEWLQSPAQALKGARPIELLCAESGCRAVEQLLKAMAHGNVI